MEAEPQREKSLRRASRMLLGLMIIVAVLALINKANQWMQLAPTASVTLLGVVFQGAAVTGKIQALELAKWLLGAALSVKVLYHVIRLLLAVSKGRLFTAQNVSELRQIGITCALAPAVWILLLICAWPEVVAAEDQWTRVMVTFPGGAVISSCLFLLGARILNEARALRDEQDLVV